MQQTDAGGRRRERRERGAGSGRLSKCWAMRRWGCGLVSTSRGAGEARGYACGHAARMYVHEQPRPMGQ